jgi:cobalt/nickel transport protein
VDKNKKFLGAGFLVSLFLAGVVSFYASSDPDGLEKVAEDIGFIETAEEHTYADGALADYRRYRHRNRWWRSLYLYCTQTQKDD